MLASRTFSAAADVIYKECSALAADDGNDTQARALLAKDHGMMPTYYLDELALRFAGERWEQGDVREFVAWLAMVTKDEVCTSHAFVFLCCTTRAVILPWVLLWHAEWGVLMRCIFTHYHHCRCRRCRWPRSFPFSTCCDSQLVLTWFPL